MGLFHLKERLASSLAPRLSDSELLKSSHTTSFSKLNSKLFEGKGFSSCFSLHLDSFFFFHHVTGHMGSQFLEQGLNSHPLHRVLTTGPQGKPLLIASFLTNISCKKSLEMKELDLTSSGLPPSSFYYVNHDCLLY